MASNRDPIDALLDQFEPRIRELHAAAAGPGGVSAYSGIVTHTVAASDPATIAVTSFTVTQLDSTHWRYEFDLSAQPAGVGVRIKYRSGHYTAWADLTSQFGGVITSSPYDATLPTIVAATEYSFGAVALVSGAESGAPIIVQVTSA